MWGSSASRSRTSRTRRDLPMPGSPESSTTWPSPSCAWRQRRRSRKISSSRPTSGVRPAGLARLEAPFGAARARDPPGRKWLGEALEPLGTEVVELEQAADQAPRRRADHDRAGRGQRLEPRREVRHFADHDLLLRRAGADQLADDDEAGRDPDPGGERAVPRRRELCDRRHELETGADCTLGVVLMRLRIAEIDQHAVAHIFGDLAVPASDHRGAAALIGAGSPHPCPRGRAGRKARSSRPGRRTSRSAGGARPRPASWPVPCRKMPRASLPPPSVARRVQPGRRPPSTAADDRRAATRGL